MNNAITWQKVFVIGEVYGMVDIREGGKAKEPDDEGNASKQIGPVKIVPAKSGSQQISGGRANISTSTLLR
jgi:hypothetical protein